MAERLEIDIKQSITVNDQTKGTEAKPSTTSPQPPSVPVQPSTTPSQQQPQAVPPTPEAVKTVEAQAVGAESATPEFQPSKPESTTSETVAQPEVSTSQEKPNILTRAAKTMRQLEEQGVPFEEWKPWLREMKLRYLKRSMPEAMPTAEAEAVKPKVQKRLFEEPQEAEQPETEVEPTEVAPTKVKRAKKPKVVEEEVTPEPVQTEKAESVKPPKRKPKTSAKPELAEPEVQPVPVEPAEPAKPTTSKEKPTEPVMPELVPVETKPAEVPKTEPKVSPTEIPEVSPPKGTEPSPVPTGVSEPTGKPKPEPSRPEVVEAELVSPIETAPAEPPKPPPPSEPPPVKKPPSGPPEEPPSGPEAVDTGDSDAGKAVDFLLAVFVPELEVVLQVFDALVDVVKMLDKAFAKMAKDASVYNPQVALAESQAQIADMFAQIRRAQTLGPELSEFIEARSEFMVDVQDLITNVAPMFIKFMTHVMHALDLLVQTMTFLADQLKSVWNSSFAETVKAQINGFIESFWFNLEQRLGQFWAAAFKAAWDYAWNSWRNKKKEDDYSKEMQGAIRDFLDPVRSREKLTRLYGTRGRNPRKGF